MTLPVYHALGGALKRLGRPNRGSLGPSAVSLISQGTVRTANSLATIASQYAASAPGDTVVIEPGTYGALTLARNLASGDVRILPWAAGAVTLGRVDLTGAVGLDIRGINTTDEVYYDTTVRTRWRGGVADLVNHVPTGHNIRGGCSDVLIEDPVVNNADCSFFLYADRDSAASTNITLRRFRSNNVGQDHVFVGRATFLTIEDFETFGHTEDAEHQDVVQIVGGKDVLIRRGHSWNPRAFRDAAIDRNDHGIICNYDPAEVGAGSTAGRVPERITVEDWLCHDMTSHGMTLAGVRGMTIRNCTVVDNGLSGAELALSIAPDSGNVIDGLVVENNILSKWGSTGATYTTNRYNHVVDGSGPVGTSRTTGSAGFVDAANADYRLAAGSACKGTGVATALTTDLYQTVRASPPSRGAIE